VYIINEGVNKIYFKKSNKNITLFLFLNIALFWSWIKLSSTLNTARSTLNTTNA